MFTTIGSLGRSPEKSSSTILSCWPPAPPSQRTILDQYSDTYESKMENYSAKSQTKSLLGGGKCLQYGRQMSGRQMFENRVQLIIWKTMKVKVLMFFCILTKGPSESIKKKPLVLVFEGGSDIEGPCALWEKEKVSSGREYGGRVKETRRTKSSIILTGMTQNKIYVTYLCENPRVWENLFLPPKQRFRHRTPVFYQQSQV